MTTTRRTIAWLRGDLRVDDNPALAVTLRIRRPAYRA